MVNLRIIQKEMVKNNVKVVDTVFIITIQVIMLVLWILLVANIKKYRCYYLNKIAICKRHNSL
ncbi:hypothetical protein HW49_06135 [Porphyromonadaceae bacterium COT-184 OH4590]|nr:hypothetical protein HW49_06135 [Porphyromonadaceae bacterium COT-184 OH4590]